MAKPTIEPISAETLPDFGAFLSRHMAYRRSAEDWVSGLRTHWRGDRPNFGFLMRENGEVVGGIGAIYAEREIRGTPVRTCNITSWCVLDSHRKWSMPLAMAVTSQPGYHFTDFSPTSVVGGVLKFLKFKPLDETVAVLPNLPTLPLKSRIVAEAEAIDRLLTGPALQVWSDHRSFPWLRHLLLGQGDRWCHVIYKVERFKKLPCARIIYRSDHDLFTDHLGALTGHLLGKGIATTHIERRFLTKLPRLARIRTGFNQKLYLSPTLSADDVDYLYSESVALDL